MALALILCATIFSKEPLGFDIGSSRVNGLQVLLALYGLYHFTRVRMAPKVGAVVIALLFFGYAVHTILGSDTEIFFKQGIPAILIFPGICAVIELVGDKQILITAYRRVCFAAALFGLVQLLLSAAGLFVLIKTPGRLDSFAQEPSYFAIAVGPAVFLALRDFVTAPKRDTIQLLVLLSAFLLTLSLTATVISIVIAVVFFFNKRSYLYSAMALGLLFYAYTNQQIIPLTLQSKIADLSAARGARVADGEILNFSVLSPASNWEVAKETLKSGRLLGNGFGGHREAYGAYYDDSVYATLGRYHANSIGGHSLFIRTVSEFGIIGLFIYIGLTLKGLSLSNNPSKVLWTILAFILVGRVIKHAGVFDLGLPIFLLAPIIFYAAKPGQKKRRRYSTKRGKSLPHP
jgi:hypothetical protein